MESVGLTPQEALRIVTHFHPEFGMEGVLQEDYGDGRVLQRVPRGRCKYMGETLYKFGPTGELLRFSWAVRVWKMMEEEGSVYLYTDTRAGIMHERGPQGAWWHQPIADGSDEIVLNDVRQNNVHAQMCWKDQ